MIHNAGFAELGLDWVCVALPVGRWGSGGRSLAMRTLGLRGMSVTMPHKSAIVAGMDRLTEVASPLGSVNCVTLRDAELIGDSTDGAGFLGGLQADFDFHPAGADCVVLGAGGAARAVVLALIGAGARSVRVINRTRSRAEHAAALGGPSAAVGAASDVAQADLVVNATPVGMGATPGAGAGLAFDAALLRPGQVVAELVYHPAETELMASGSATLAAAPRTACRCWSTRRRSRSRTGPVSPHRSGR